MNTESEKKLRILLVEDEIDLREVVTFMLESQYPVIVTEASSGNQAIGFLQEQANYDLIICDYNMSNGNGGDVFRFLKSHNIDIPYVMFSSERPDAHEEFTGHQLFGHIEKPAFAEPLKKIFSELIDKKSGQEKMRLSPPDIFVQVRCRTLLLLTIPLPCDLYVRLTDNKFVKVLNQNDSFDVEEFNRFIQKQVTVLYVLRDDAESFLKHFTRELLLYDEASEGTLDDLMAISEQVQNTLSEMSNVLGFSKEVQNLAKTNVDLAMRFIAKNKNLAQLFRQIKVDADGYLHSHSVALAHVASGLALQMGWDSDATVYKLALAAFLHDITLPDSRLAKVKSLQDPYLSPEDIAIVKGHAQKAADIAAAFTDVPPDINVIVAQHHERGDGSGFPVGMNHVRIAPLSCLFIVAHDLVDFFAEHGGTTKNLPQFIQEKESVYTQGYFKKVYTTLALNAAASHL